MADCYNHSQLGLGDYSIIRYYRYLITDDNRIAVYNAKNDIIVECACANKINLFTVAL